MLTISRLTEEETVSGRNILSFTKIVSDINRHGSKSISSNLSKMLADLKIDMKPILDWRNNAIAHKNYEKSANPSNNPLPEISYKEMSDIITKINDLMNTISDYLGLDRILYDQVWISGGADDLMAFLKMGLSYSTSKFDLMQATSQIAKIIRSI